MNQPKIVIRQDYLKGIGLGLLVLALVAVVGLGTRAVLPLLAAGPVETPPAARQTPVASNPLAPAGTPAAGPAPTARKAEPAASVVASLGAPTAAPGGGGATPTTSKGIALDPTTARPGDLVQVTGWGWTDERLVKLALIQPGAQPGSRTHGAAAPDAQGQFQVQLLVPYDWTTAKADVVAWGAETAPIRAPLQVGSEAAAPTPTIQPTATATPSDVSRTRTSGSTGAKTPASSAQAGGTMRVGVRANLLVAPVHRERTLRLARELGVRWIGQQVVWRDLEGVQNQRDFRFLDDAVGEAHAQGFQILLSVTKAPAWAQQGSRIDPAAYGDFVAALVSRYRGKVQAIEFYNEPNLAAEWGGPCSAGAYTALLKEAYRRVKTVDPAVVVVSAGLTPTGVSDGHTAVEDTVFLAQVKQAGGLDFCDAVGVHVSGFNNPPDAAPGSRCAENPQYGCHGSFYVLRYRELQRIAGDRPLWVTECGYASTNDPQPGYEYARDNPESALGDTLAATLKLLRGDKVGAAFWWNLNYAPLAPGSEQAAFSLVDQHWNPRPHYHRLKSELGH